MVCRVRWIFHHEPEKKGVLSLVGCVSGEESTEGSSTVPRRQPTQTPTHSGHNTQFNDDKTTARAPTRALCGIVAIIAESFLAIAPVTPVEVLALPSLATQLCVSCLCAFVSVCAGKKKWKRFLFYFILFFHFNPGLCVAVISALTFMIKKGKKLNKTIHWQCTSVNHML